MNKKIISAVYVSMAMLSVGIMVVVGTISGSWNNLWLFPFGAMIIATVFAMFVGAIGEGASCDDSKKSDNKKSSNKK